MFAECNGWKVSFLIIPARSFFMKAEPLPWIDSSK